MTRVIPSGSSGDDDESGNSGSSGASGDSGNSGRVVVPRVQVVVTKVVIAAAGCKW